MVAEHPGRGDNTGLRRKKAFGLVGELCGWNKGKKGWEREGGVKKERKERISYMHMFLIHSHQLFYILLFPLNPRCSPYH